MWLAWSTRGMMTTTQVARKLHHQWRYRQCSRQNDWSKLRKKFSRHPKAQGLIVSRGPNLITTCFNSKLKWQWSTSLPSSTPSVSRRRRLMPWTWSNRKQSSRRESISQQRGVYRTSMKPAVMPMMRKNRGRVSHQQHSNVGTSSPARTLGWLSASRSTNLIVKMVL